VPISYPWSPPELLDGRSDGSVTSDVYPLGATIWNLPTGRSPYSVPNGDNSPRALTARILHAAPQSALELGRALQRIETEAGYSRTPIAVEGDRPAPGLSWSSPDAGQAGDTWEWKRTDTGESRRTEEARLAVTSSSRTCLQVRLIRGSYASPWTEDCVG
jgi:hypothetical protein